METSVTKVQQQPKRPDSPITAKTFADFIRETLPGCGADPLFEQRVAQIFRKFATSSSDDGGKASMSEQEFDKFRDSLLRNCVQPKSALVVVDFQNDFIDGTLSLKKCPRGENPELLITGLNRMIDLFDTVVYTFDHHPEGHISFIECLSKRKLHSSCKVGVDTVQVSQEVVLDIGGKPVSQRMWPRHCVQGTQGAALHKDLKVKKDAIVVYKGTDVDVDSYSAFWDNSHTFHTDLTDKLRKHQVTNLLITGLAFDACVCWTAADAIAEGFSTSVVRDLTCSISDDMTLEAETRLKGTHCPLISSTDVNSRTISGPLPWVLLWQQAVRLCGEPKGV